jgi:hypothetical protein
MRNAALIFPAFFCLTITAAAQTRQENIDESKVKPYTLPDPLTLLNGQKVKTADQWRTKRRPEIVRLFEENVHGRTPVSSVVPRFEVVSTDRQALGGKAVRKQVVISFEGRDSGPKIHMLLYLPRNAKGQVPVFVGLNFTGNHAVYADPGITLRDTWVKQVRTPASEQSRGQAAGRWPVERILSRGYGVATAYYGDIEPDFDGGRKYGVRQMLQEAGKEPVANEWGAIGAWAWGLSRMADYLVTDKEVDGKRLAVMGHSRLGKAALWAGAQDERFGIVISNDSGEGGAALSKRNFGEEVWGLNHNFPHWFSAAYRQYSNNESALPVDHHMLIALIAPRPVYVASAAEDLHADPRGEFLAAVHAGPVYELLGKQGLGTDGMPGLHEPIQKTVGYHIRAGKHDVTEYDWDRFCDFADLHWRRK